MKITIHTMAVSLRVGKSRHFLGGAQWRVAGVELAHVPTGVRLLDGPSQRDSTSNQQGSPPQKTRADRSRAERCVVDPRLRQPPAPLKPTTFDDCGAGS